MAFGEDYQAIPSAQLKNTKEMYNKQQGTADKQYEPKPDKFVPIKEKSSVQIKPVGLGSKFKEVFFINDPAVAREKVFTQIFVPQIKDLFMNIIWGYFSGIIYDNPMSSPRGGSFLGRADVYNRASNNRGGITVIRGGSEKNVRNDRQVGLDSKRMDVSISFDTMPEAREYLDTFIAEIDRYGNLSIANVYEQCGYTNYPYTNQYWGWKSLAGATINRMPDGRYAIVFPRAEAIGPTSG